MKLAAALVIVILGWTSSAHAQEATRTERYPLWLAPLDATAATLVISGAARDNEELVGAGAFLYVVGAPVVHMAKGNGGAAAKSLGTRLALPLAGAAIGMGLLYDELKEDCFECGLHFPNLRPAAIGAGVGMAIAIAVDYTFFAQREVAAEPRVAPTASATAGGFTVGVAGTW